MRFLSQPSAKSTCERRYGGTLTKWRQNVNSVPTEDMFSTNHLNDSDLDEKYTDEETSRKEDSQKPLEEDVIEEIESYRNISLIAAGDTQLGMLLLLLR